MDETDTTMLERCKENISKHKKKAVVGVSAATLAAVYAVFVTQHHFDTHAQTEKESRAAQWRAHQDLVKEVELQGKQIERLEGYLQGAGVLPVKPNMKTNTP